MEITSLLMVRGAGWAPCAHKTYLKLFSLLLDEMLTPPQSSSPKVPECVSKLNSHTLQVLVFTAKIIWS